MHLLPKLLNSPITLEISSFVATSLRIVFIIASLSSGSEAASGTSSLVNLFLAFSSASSSSTSF